MNGHAASKVSLSHEEGMGLLDEKTLSDVESESGRADLEVRFAIPRWSTVARGVVGYARAVPWRVTVIRGLIFLLPSFVQSRFTRERGRTDKLFPTSHLDGMRGLAALFVFFCHYFYQAFIIAEGWGSSEKNYHILKMPFFRLFYQGPPAVCLFFVISGYALSMKPIKLARAGNMEEFSVTTTSLIFRRFIRLYMPTAISTFCIMLLLQFGVYEWTRDFAIDRAFHKNVMEPHPKPLDTFSEQFYDWVWSMFSFVHVFGWERFGGSTSYDVHLWTIPVEFRCSMYLFITLIGLARVRSGLRLLFLSGIIAFTYRNNRWELLLFYFGMMLAEYDQIMGNNTPVQQPSVLPANGAAPPQGSRLKGFLWAMLSILAIYFMCQPDINYEITPGWVWLCSFIPKWWEEEGYRFWQSIGAVIFVLCVGHSPRWKSFFNLAPIQYLGKISYALYLMHGPVMHTVGYMIERRVYAITGLEGWWYNAGFVLGSFGCIPAVIWAADVFWRLFDIPTVRFAKWFETKCLVKQE
ncbi:acyltransferase [Colletotrichum godetiae]|uniref:Acyltransferase n=1 Tax=Colletotrichum godetiae TaxID=1209918 RepID=A0AAJ0AS93_9PEZI|nr:acyltransferase [Colletotrichum godetiae]KAK1688823.1 acyltransferase [Colletotrichum godetiae]